MPSPERTLSQLTRSSDRHLVARLHRRAADFKLIRHVWKEYQGPIARGSVLAFAAVALGGCAVGRELGTGAPMLGVTTQTVNDSIANAGAWGGFIGNAGALFGVGAPAGLAASLLTWLAGRAAKKREDAAWDEAARDAERQALITAIAGGGRNAGGGAAGGGVGTQEES